MILYTDHDQYVCDWTERLVWEGKLEPGRVWCRELEEVRPDELGRFTQAHFFNGIGGWPLALKLAGWPEDLECWTGSCPCQPFSSASRGRTRGISDPRHLWPAWFRLIRERRPRVVMGEQVQSPAAVEWMRAARDDLQRAGYRVVVASLCASAFGFPPRRRLYFAADANSEGERPRPVDAEVAGLPETPAVAEDSWRELRRVGPDRDGIPSGMGRRRAYGNAIVPQVAAEFARTFMEAIA